MEYTLQNNTQTTTLPAMKRARLLITTALLLQVLNWIAFGPFSFSILEYLNGDYQSYTLIGTIRSLLSTILFTAGYLQLCFTGDRLYRLAGILLSVGSVIGLFLPGLLYLLFGVGAHVSNIIPFNNIFYILGLSALWLAGNSSDRKILTTIASIWLFSIFGYAIMNGNLSSFSDHSNPFVYLMQKWHDNGVTSTELHFVYLITSIAELILWWRFCSTATPDADRTEAGFVQILTSRFFISYIICGIIMMLTLNFLSHQILS